MYALICTRKWRLARPRDAQIELVQNKVYISLFSETFFENIILDLRLVIKIIGKYVAGTSRTAIYRSMCNDYQTITKIVNKIIERMP